MATHDEVRILIVEDETLQALVMKENLEGELGACVEAAACCADARGKLAAGEYDIVTLDYQLPDGNGLELLQDIVDKDDAPLVIMVTGHGDEEVAATALGLGAFGYVVKDNRMSTLLIDSVTKATVQLAMQRTERALRERQAVLQSAIETMTDLFFLIEPQGKLLAWNKRVEDLLGYSSEELSSLNIITARAGTDRPAVRDGIDLALGNNTYARYELELIAKDGTRIPFEFTGAMVLDDEGGTIGITGIGRDITERRNSEARLRASEERYRAIVEDQIDLVCRFDPGTYRLTYVNEAYARCFDMEREELLGSSFLLLVDEEDRADVAARISAIAQGGEVGIVEERVVASDGEIRWQQWMNRPIQGPDGEVVEMQAVGRDITELKRVNDEVEAQRDLALGAASAGSLNEVLEMCLNAAIRISGMDSGGIYLVDETSGQYVLRCTSGLSDFFIEAVGCLEVSNEEFKLAAGGMPDYLDLETLHSSLFEVEAREGLKAAGVVPVVHEGEVIACVNVASHTLDSFPLWGRGPLEAVAAHIGLHLANEVAEAKMRASEEKFEAAFLHAPDIMAVIEAESGAVVDVNHAFCDATGYAREDVIGRNYMELDIMPARYDHERLVRHLEKEGPIYNLGG